MKREKVIDWKFDEKLWQSSIELAIEMLGCDFVAAATGLHKTTLFNWAHGKFNGDFRYPNMTHFLALCNLMDWDVRNFFVLDG